MGGLMIKESDDVRLVDVPKKKIENADVIRSGDWVFIRYSNPQYGCSDFSVCRIYETEKWTFPLCLKSWPWQREFMAVLVKIGLMTKERQAELIEIDRQRAEDQQRKLDAEKLTALANRYGLQSLVAVAESLHTTKG